MITELSRNEEKLFLDIMEERKNPQYHFIKTIEECSELSQSIAKLVGHLGDRKRLNKVHQDVNNIVEEMVDVQIQLFILKMELIKQYLGEGNFEMLWNAKYVDKMQIIRNKLEEIKRKD